MNGVCRWCYELTASPKTRWHRYCLNLYWVASGQPPSEIHHTLCEICGDVADELDHRLSIEVARGLGRAALLRAFVPGNLRWLCHDCHRRKTRQDRILAKFVRACGIDWQTAQMLRGEQREWLDAFPLPYSLSAPVSEGRERLRPTRSQVTGVPLERSGQMVDCRALHQ